MLASCQRARDHLVDAAHALAVRAHHGDGAEIVQHVLGRHGLRAHAALGEGDVLGNARRQIVRHHRHVQMLVERVDREGIGRIGRRRQAVRLAVAADDVGRVAAAGTLGVIHVDGAATDRLHRAFVEAGLVDGVGVELDLEVVLVGDLQAGVDGGGHGAEILVDLHADDAAGELLDDGLGLVRAAAREEAEIHGEAFGRAQHLLGRPGPAAIDGEGRAERAAEHGGDAARERVGALVGADEMHMHVEAADGGDHALADEDLRVRPDDQARIDAGHDVGIAGLADGDDLAALDADVALDDAGDRIDDEHVDDDHVDGAVGEAMAGIDAHAVAQRLAAADHALLAIDGVVVLDLDQQRGIAEPHEIAGRRAVHGGVVLAAHRDHRLPPSIRRP